MVQFNSVFCKWTFGINHKKTNDLKRETICLLKSHLCV